MKTIEVVCGVLQKDGRYLIARRAQGIHENIWEFPGGKVEEKETHEEAVVREIHEELALDVRVIEGLCEVVDHREDMDIHVSAYLCEWCGGEIELQAHHEYRFVEPSALFDYTFEESDKEILEILNKRRDCL